MYPYYPTCTLQLSLETMSLYEVLPKLPLMSDEPESEPDGNRSLNKNQDGASARTASLTTFDCSC